mgnify:CR=1 FL=1
MDDVAVGTLLASTLRVSVPLILPKCKPGRRCIVVENWLKACRPALVATHRMAPVSPKPGSPGWEASTHNILPSS